jgi:putative lipase involved disintegration of autophagic bodies
MVNCLDYAKIAFAAYFTGVSQYYEDPSGHMVDDWTVQHWETGTLFGDGFQGGIWQSKTDVVVGCCGTNPGQKGTLVSGLGADAKIGLRILPNQCSSARQMVVKAKEIAGNRRVSVTGHSLGGGLSQVMGVWEQVPFVTFNAPAMKDVIRAANINVFKPMMMARTLKAKSPDESVGVNFRIRGLGSDGMVRNDKVSMEGVAGEHVGMVVDLPAASSTGAHGKNTCWQAVLATDWSGVDPFGG